MKPNAECARHPGRAALTICNRCDRPICGDDLIDAPVGWQCVDCAHPTPPERQPDHTLPERQPDDPTPTPKATRALILTILAITALNLTGVIDARTFGLNTLDVGFGEWWRLVTSAFLHGGLVHLAFNLLLLRWLGQMLEPETGPGPFLGLAASGMAGGSLGVVSLDRVMHATPLASSPAAIWLLGNDPSTITVGASGAVFGLMGAALMLTRRRGVSPWSTSDGSTVGALVLLNLVLTFAIPSISVGGHLGGLLGGGVAAMMVTGRRAGDTLRTVSLAIALLGIAIPIARQAAILLYS